MGIAHRNMEGLNLQPPALLVQLVGEQPLPNLIPARFLKPEHVLLVHTDRTKEVAQRLEQLLPHCEFLSCDAYNIELIIAELNKALSKYLPSGRVLFNLTGGTKPMSLAAYQVAQKRGAPIAYFISERGRNALQVYEWAGDTPCLRSEVSVGDTVSISLEEFLDAHLGKDKWKATGPSRDLGGEFESAVAEVIKGLGVAVLQGVRTLETTPNRPQVDVDILAGHRNTFLLVECKTGARVKTLDALRQLNLVRPLFSTYTKQLAALSDEPNPDHRMVYEVTSTEYVALSSYNNSSGKFSEDDVQKLKNTIRKLLHLD